MQRRIILASSSPRRKEIFETTGLPFEIVHSNYEEDMTLPLPPEELARFLSKGKAKVVAKNYLDAIIISADTFVVFNNKIIGKPHTEEKAFETLEMLSGQTHLVITGFTIIDTKNSKIFSKAIETKVIFKNLSEKEINSYISTGEPLDKGGSYAIQGLGGNFIEKIEGDYNNVIGFPLDEIKKALKDFGIKVKN